MALTDLSFRWAPSGTGFRVAASSGWYRFYRSFSSRLRQGRMNPLKRLILNVLLGVNRRIVTFAQTRPVIVRGRFADGTVFGYPFGDPYWTRAGLETAEYESEILAFLAKVRDLPFDFVDCGANFGYWSALVTGAALGQHRAVAIEGSQVTFNILQANCQMNSARFAVLNNAIAEKDGETVRFHHSVEHAGNQILEATATAPGSSGLTESVLTLSIDSLIAQYTTPGNPVFVKLDVEGHEIQAIKGMQRSLSRDILLVYEDHGDDPDSGVTGFLLAEGWAVFWPCMDRLGNLTLEPVTDIEEIRARKNNPHKGYNLYAQPPREESVWHTFLDH